MSSELTCDEDLVRKLPLPLAQLYRRAHNAQSAVERHHAAYYLWEATLKLLGSVAIVEFAALRMPDAELGERLQNLVRPATGHWWEFVRRLVPVLADAEVRQFDAVRRLILGRSRSDLPKLQRLDEAICGVLQKDCGKRVCLTELFDRLIKYRNQEIGHGAGGLRPEAFYRETGAAILEGTGELLCHLNVLVGRRLVYISKVARQPSGNWLVERVALAGESVKRLAPIELPSTAAEQLPRPQCLYLESVPLADAAEPPPTDWLSLHPLLVYDADTSQVFFLTSQHNAQHAQYLCYRSGETVYRANLGKDLQDLLARVLHKPFEAKPLDAPVAPSPIDDGEPQPPAVVEEPVKPSVAGQKLGEFELLSRIGRGNMGVVYRAWQPSLGRQVALKSLLRPDDEQAEARFRREIRAVGHIENPHVVKAFTSGSDGEHWFYAMELIEGTDLANVCRELADATASEVGAEDWQQAVTSACGHARTKEQPLSSYRPDSVPAAAGQVRPSDSTPSSASSPISTAAQEAIRAGGRSHIAYVVKLIRQIAEGAHALHEGGVVHRDIKPGNIMITPDGSRAVLTDLGLAQLSGAESITKTRGFVGTLRYASPEQVLAAERVDRRSDVYSLGATLWELLTLRPLFGATEQTSAPELMKWIQHRDPDRIQTHNPKVPKDLEAVVMKCLEKEPEHRYQTAAELAADLDRWLNDRPVSVRHGALYRTRKYLRRHRGLVATAVSAIVLAAVGSVGYWYAFEREYVAYYADLVFRWDVMEGVNPISGEQASHRQASYKIYRRGRFGPVTRGDIVNGSGLLTYGNMSASIDASDEGEDYDVGRCDYTPHVVDGITRYDMQAYNIFGEPMWTFIWNNSRRGHYQDAHGRPSPRADSGAAYVEFDFTPEGYATRQTFFDVAFEEPKPSKGGVYASEAVRNSLGQTIRYTTLGRDGQPIIPDSSSFYEAAVIETEYNDLNQLVERRFLGPDGKPVKTAAGYICRYEYDEHGNQKQVSYLDADRKPVLNELLIAGHRVERDEWGNETRREFLGVDGKPTRHQSGNFGWTAKYENGRMTEQTNFGYDGSSKGFAQLTYKYDERGRTLEGAWLDEGGQPVLHAQQKIAGWRCQYEGNKKNEIRREFFGTGGEPVRHKDGHLGWTAKYDRGRMIEQINFGYDGSQGFAKTQSMFDRRGRLIEGAFLDEAGNPTPLPWKIAGWRAEFEGDTKNEIKREYFGADRQPTRHRDGYIGWLARYDSNRKLIERTYFGYDDGSGYTRLANKLDNLNRVTEARYLDDNDRPVRNLSDGIAGWRSEYEGDTKNEIRREYLGTDGKPARHKDGNLGWTARYEGSRKVEETHFGHDGSRGFERLTFKYDDHGRSLEASYLNERAQPALDLWSRVSGWRSEYEGDSTQEARREVFGVDRRPVRHRDGFTSWFLRESGSDKSVEKVFVGYDGSLGFVQLVNKLDALNRVVEARYLDANDRPAVHRIEQIAGWRSQYDGATKNEIEREYFGPDGKPARHIEGNLGWTAKYDGPRMVEQTKYGYDGRRGFERIRFKSDQLGRTVEGNYLSQDSIPVLDYKHGVAGWRSQYEGDTNLEIRRDFIGPNGEPFRHIQGNRGWIARHVDGRMVEQTLFGYDSGLLGYAQAETQYDAMGRVTEAMFLNEAGEPAADKVSLVAGWRSEYDEESGQESKHTFLGVDRKPARHADGNLGWTSRYESGRMVGQTYFGYDGGLGYTQISYKIDELARAVEGTYLDDQGEPVVHSEAGIAGWRSQYEGETNNEIQRDYFGLDGQPARHRDGNLGWRTRFEDNLAVETTQFGFEDADIGYSEMVIRFTAAGDVADKVYLNEDGKRVETHAVIDEVVPDSQAEERGLLPGDIVLEYNGVAGRADQITGEARRIAAAGRPARPVMTILRGGEKKELAFEPRQIGVLMIDRGAHRVAKPVAPAEKALPETP